jgi:transcriptional regulator with PAS, ATPase and Fis domain
MRHPDSPTLIGVSPAILALSQELEYAGRSDAKVLITGESGVGKEVAARLIHRNSGRSRASLLTLNCAGMPETLLESELFGHARGSFTGAYRDKVGLLEAAHTGTVFLDEVGDTSLRMQSVLLRFLETGEIQRIGSPRVDTRVDVRVIAATNCNLTQAIADGKFREDLYYRLNVIHLTVPPLRERLEDVPLLLSHFLTAYAEQYRVEAPSLSPEATAMLNGYHWPGNVRELKNVIERVVVTQRRKVIAPSDLPIELRNAPRPVVTSGAAQPPAPSVVDVLYDQVVVKRQSFWSVVYAPFMARDLTRADLRNLVARGLEETSGSYRTLVTLFNMDPSDYKRFLNFLRKHQCHMPFQKFRGIAAPADGSSDGRESWKITA